MAIDTTHDIVPDSPTNTFATLNPLHKDSAVTLSDGNLSLSSTTRGNQVANFVIPPVGRWYYEGKGERYVGSICDPSFILNADVSASSADALAIGFWQAGHIYDGINSYVDTGYPYTSSNIIGIYVDFDSATQSVSFYVDGTLAYTYNFTGSNRTFPNGCYPNYNNGDSATSTSTCAFNFGQDPSFGSTYPSTTYTDSGGIGQFNYKPVDSNGNDLEFYALCTANLPDPDIDPNVDDLPEDYFKAVLYTGTNSTQNINVGMTPDLVWLKNRNSANSHYLIDSVRGITSGLSSDTTGHYPTTGSNDFTGFLSTSNGDSVNGFSVGSVSAFNSSNKIDGTDNIIAWCWKAGGAPSATDDGTGVNATGSAKLIDTSGTASSTTCKSFKDAAETAGASNVICPSKMSINQKAGFSIVKYTGIGGAATIPHGLDSAPEFYIVKETTATGPDASWGVYHVPEVLKLKFDNTAGGSGTNAGGGGNMTTDLVTESVLGIKSGTSNANNVNNSGSEYIVYAWHSVAGYSAFGSFTGNGSATGDGPFIYTGFKPAWVMVKRVDSTGSWMIIDSTRNPYNVVIDFMLAESANSEAGTQPRFDFVSNGLKVRAPLAYTPNESSTAEYIYAAFAEMPTKYATAR